MSTTLFPEKPMPEYIFDLKYEGPSFNGMMEIDALKNEIAGLEEVIKIATHVLYKNKKISFSPDDIKIFIEAFEKGSFRKKVKLTLKTLNDCQGTLTLATVILAIIAIIQNNNTKDITEMSPQMISEIASPSKIELLQNKSFLSSTANIIIPLEKTGDKLNINSPENEVSVIKYEDKNKFITLGGAQLLHSGINGDQFEVLRGRINRVDLDATRRHLGFKVNSEGNSIPATLSDPAKGLNNMKDLLGQWVQVKAISSYKNGLRDHVEIQSLKVIKQEKLNF